MRKLLFCVLLLQTANVSFSNIIESSILPMDKHADKSQICKSWIFISKSDNFLEEFKQSSVELSSELRTKIVYTHKVGTNFSMLELDQEYNLEDIHMSTNIGLIRLSPHCQVVFIYMKTVKESAKSVGKLIKDKIILPQKDYFIFIGNKGVVETFCHSKLGNDIRYKTMLQLVKPYNNGTGENFTPVKVIDLCRNIEGSVKLYTRKCKHLIAGKNLNIIAVFGTPLMKFSRTEDGKIIGSGIYGNMITESSIKMNYTYSLQYVTGSGLKRDGKWSGAVKEISSRNGDFAVCCGLTPERNFIMGAATSIEWIHRVFFMKAPHLKTNWKALFWPFTPTVWTLILLTIWILYLINTFLQSFQRFSGNLNFGTVLIGILFDQSYLQRKKHFTYTRSILLQWTLFCLIIGAGYRSRLINYLTFILPEPSPSTYKEIVQENYQLYFRYYGGVAFDYVKKSKDPVQEMIIQKSLLINSSDSCILAALFNEKSVCLDWSFHGMRSTYSNTTLYVHQTHGLVEMSHDSSQMVLLAWLFRKRSPYTETFDDFIINIFATGLYNKWNSEDITQTKIVGSRWLKSNPDSQITKELVEILNKFDSNPKPLQLNSLFGLFFIGVSLIVCGIIVFFIEIFFKNFNIRP